MGNYKLESECDLSLPAWNERDLPEMLEIWNEIIREGNAFPQTEELSLTTGKDFFSSQSRCAVYRDTGGRLLGLYILHPNNVGRCSHIANASYAVAKNSRARGIGKKLVMDSLAQAAALGFAILQFNAVVESNIRARKLYENLGFNLLGIIEEGFENKKGEKENICVYWRKTSR